MSQNSKWANMISKDMVLTVVVAAYNCATTISRTIASIFRSGEIEGSNRYEIVVIDDGSIDDTSSVLDKLCHKYPCVRTATQINCGASAARNKGVELAHGDYVAFVDSDDYVDDAFIPTLLPLLESRIFDCVLFGTRSVALDGRESLLGKLPAKSYETDARGFFREILDPLGGYQGFVCGKAVKRDLFWNNHAFFGFDTSIEILEDEWLWLNIASRCKRVYLCEKVLYNYCVRLDSATSRINARGGWDDLDMRDRIVEFASSACPEHAELARWWRRLKTCSMARRFYVTNDSASLERLRPRWREARKGLKLSRSPIGHKRVVEIALCDFAMMTRVPPCVLAPFRRVLSWGNERLMAGAPEGKVC